MIGHQYGRFTLLRKLPAGGMGRVFEANDPLNGRRIALKLIDKGTDSDSMQIVAAEKLGAELQRRLCALDQRITSVYETGELPEYFYIVMEYVDGQDLSELTAREKLGHIFAARIAEDVLDVLNHAHNFRSVIGEREYRGIVHGDIKPRNIRLTNIGQVKVLDFGIAKALSMTRSFTQNVFGSVPYSSPERLNSGEVTVSSDLWAVGVVLYELIAHRPYFSEENGSRLENLIRNYRELRPLPDEAPEALRRILARALSPDPAQRYQNAADFAADLNAYRREQIPQSVTDTEDTRRIDRTSGDAETRRVGQSTTTMPINGDVEATRRTSRPPELPRATPVPPTRFSVGAQPHVQSQPRVPRVRLRIGRLFLLGFLATILIGVYLVVSEYTVWQGGRALARELDTEKVSQLDDAWQRYQNLSSRAHLGASLWSAQDALKSRLMADADRQINEYRSADTPAVSENDWVRARASTVRALELMPHDKQIRGKLKLIDGHLMRIRGSARRDGKMLEQAREDFVEAADLMSKQPDPWLGLARLYVYSLHDVDKGEEALKQAEKRGHDIGKRETAQLADGYRDRAERTLREGERAKTSDEAEHYFGSARNDLERARKLYESIVPWGGASTNLRKTNDLLARVDNENLDRPARED